jgi:hypothetical protein
MRIAIDAVKSGFKNPEDTFKWFINTVEARRRPFDPEHALDIIADVTETERQQIESYYEEITGPVAELYNSRFQKMITESPGSHIRRRVLGFERWIGIDRIAWYCLLRAESPSTVVETGVLRGESSLFALEALRRNGGGGNLFHLISAEKQCRNSTLGQHMKRRWDSSFLMICTTVGN